GVEGRDTSAADAWGQTDRPPDPSRLVPVPTTLRRGDHAAIADSVSPDGNDGVGSWPQLGGPGLFRWRTCGAIQPAVTPVLPKRDRGASAFRCGDGRQEARETAAGRRLRADVVTGISTALERLPASRRTAPTLGLSHDHGRQRSQDSHGQLLWR